MGVEIRKEDIGRILRISIGSKRLETPHFFPVIRRGEKVSIPTAGVITSAYLLRKAGYRGDVHEAIGFDGIVMTDSGAYQIIAYRTPISVSPDEIVEYQKEINSDIAVILDEPIFHEDSEEEARRKARETVRRAREAKIDDKRIRVMPIHGVRRPKILERMIRNADFNRFSMAALGGVVPLMEKYDYASVVEATVIARSLLPASVPLHVFGAGHPTLIPFLVAAGADTFDSASYALYAKSGRYMTPWGTYSLDDLTELPCTCPICLNRDPQELKRNPELLALHNYYVILQEVLRVREAIRLGRLREYLEMKARTHPAAMDALKVLIKYRHLIRPRAARFRSRGMFLYDRESLLRPDAPEIPEVPKEGRILLIISKEPPLRKLEEFSEYDHVIYVTPRGLIPAELSETYPFSQTELPEYLRQELLDYRIKKAKEIRKEFDVKELERCI